MAKLLPPSVHGNPEPIDVSPLTPKDFLLLPDVQTIIAIRGYDREHQERHVLFAKRITFLLRDKSVTEKNIRDAIMLFLRMYPESLATKRGT